MSNDGEHDSAIARTERSIALYGRLAIVLIMIGVLVGFWAISRFGTGHAELAELGGFLSGTVGAIWSLGGLTLVYVAFLGQQVQILNQKRDLQLTHDAMIAQRDEMAQQTALIQRQQFENTFFSLLAAHQALTAAVELNAGYGDARGTEAFRHFYKALESHYDNALERTPDAHPLTVAAENYAHLYGSSEHALGPYFRSLYHLIKFADEGARFGPGRDERKRYVNFVRARLSIFEVGVLFYNGLAEPGRGMRPLIERYALLKHIQPHQFLSPSHRDGYPPQAFASVGG